MAKNVYSLNNHVFEEYLGFKLGFFHMQKVNL